MDNQEAFHQKATDILQTLGFLELSQKAQSENSAEHSDTENDETPESDNQPENSASPEIETIEEQQIEDIKDSEGVEQNRRRYLLLKRQALLNNILQNPLQKTPQEI